MDIESYSNFIFAEFLKKTKNSALFIESDLFNYIQFLGGIPRLMNDGSVKFVMELVADQITPHTCTKAVFLIKYKLTPRIKDQIKQIIQNSESRLNYCCVIITTPSVSDENFSIFSKMESDLLEWMGNKDFTAEVLSMPLFLASLSTDLFICPTYGSLYPNLDNSFFHSDFDHLPPDCRENLESLVANLHNFLKSTNLSQEIYCVGPTSSILGQKLANLGHKRQAATNDTCSLILVDRNTDLISPVIGRKFSAFDHILASNDTLSGHFNEKCVKLDQAMDFPPFTLFDRIDNQEVCDFIQQLIEKSPEDCLIIGKEKILRILQHQSKKEFPSSNFSELLADYWESSIKFSDDFSPIFPHLLALTKNDDNFNGDTVLSTLQCLEMMASLSWDGGCLTDFVQYSAENKFALYDDVQYLTALYTMAGQKSLKWNYDDCKTYLIGKYAKEQAKHAPMSSSGAILVVENLFNKLKNVAKLRHVLGTQHYRTPYIENLVERIFDPTKPSLDELSCKTSSFSLSSLNSFLNLAAKAPKPCDSKLCVFFIVGGITGYEISRFRQKLKQLHIKRSEKQILIGSNSFITTAEILREMLVTNDVC